MSRFASHQDYFNSREWKLLRRVVRLRANHKCERCKTRAGHACHHWNGYYYQQRKETPDDLMFLCEGCHAWEDCYSDTDPLAGDLIEQWEYFMDLTSSLLRDHWEPYPEAIDVEYPTRKWRWIQILDGLIHALEEIEHRMRGLVYFTEHVETPCAPWHGIPQVFVLDSTSVCLERLHETRTQEYRRYLWANEACYQQDETLEERALSWRTEMFVGLPGAVAVGQVIQDMEAFVTRLTHSHA